MDFRIFIICCYVSLTSTSLFYDNVTFRMNGIFPITYYDRVNYQSGVMMAEAMKYAVETINNKTNYLYGYKLDVKRLFNINEYIKLSDTVLSTFMSDVPFLIGPYSSESSYVTSILTATFRQVVISYAATYRDFDRLGVEGNMVRTIPSDVFRVQAALDLTRHLKWNYIAVLNSYGYNGERDARFFISKLTSIGVCLADQVHLLRSPTQNNYHEAILNLNVDHRLKAVFMFTTRDDSRELLKAIQNLRLYDRFYLVCIYGCTNYIEVVKGKEKAAIGTLSLDIHCPEVLGFKSYFLKQHPSMNHARYFRELWRSLFNCTLKGNSNYKACTGNEKLTVGHGYYPVTPVHTVIDAVYAVANAIKRLLEHYCPVQPNEATPKQCIIDASNRNLYSHTAFRFLLNMSFIDGTLDTMKTWFPSAPRSVRYDIHNFRSVNGTFSNVYVGKWEIKRPYVNQYAEDVLRFETPIFEIYDARISLGYNVTNPLAVCSAQCPSLHRRVKDLNVMKALCCWTCSQCPENNISINETCVPCKETEEVNKQNNKCIALPAHYIHISDPLSSMFMFLSVLGLCLTMIVFAMFIHNNDNNIVRSSGRDLCYAMLLGISLTFICPFTYLTKPSVMSCLFRGTLPGVSFLICYAPLFLKTNRIYRIFQNAKISVTRPTLISTQSQLLLLLGIVAVQLLLASVWFASKHPEPSEIVSDSRKYITLHCKGDADPILMLLRLVLSVVFMFSCTVLAFKTRHFPKNYNEAKYIGITLYITCVAWAVFFPAFFLAPGKDEFLKEYFMCGICVTIGYITLFGLFSQKIKLLLVPKPLESFPQMLSVTHTRRMYADKEISSSQQDLKSFTDDNVHGVAPTQVFKPSGVVTNGNTPAVKNNEDYTYNSTITL